MKARLLWTPQARQDLISIFEWIAHKDVEAAEKICDGIERYVLLLKQFPRLGLRRPSVHPHSRLLICGTYLLLYRIEADSGERNSETVQIVRIVHGHRNLAGLL